MAAPVSRRKQMLREAASSGVSGGVRRVLTCPGRGALVMTTNAQFFTCLKKSFLDQPLSLIFIVLISADETGSVLKKRMLVKVLITFVAAADKESAEQDDGVYWRLLEVIRDFFESPLPALGPARDFCGEASFGTEDCASY